MEYRAIGHMVIARAGSAVREAARHQFGFAGYDRDASNLDGRLARNRRQCAQLSPSNGRNAPPEDSLSFICAHQDRAGPERYILAVTFCYANPGCGMASGEVRGLCEACSSQGAGVDAVALHKSGI